MAKSNLSSRQKIVVQALKLTQVAENEGMSYRTAQKRKDLFTLVEIPSGIDPKTGKEKIKKRYLGRKITELLRASGLFIS